MYLFQFVHFRDQLARLDKVYPFCLLALSSCKSPDLWLLKQVCAHFVGSIESIDQVNQTRVSFLDFRFLSQRSSTLAKEL